MGNWFAKTRQFSTADHQVHHPPTPLKRSMVTTFLVPGSPQWGHEGDSNDSFQLKILRQTHNITYLQPMMVQLGALPGIMVISG